MASVEEMMVDLRRADASGDTQLASHIASLIRDAESKGPVTQPIKPSESSQAASFLGGASGTTRGIVSKLFGKEIGPDFAGVPIDTESGAYLAGSFLDPAAAGIGGAAVKGVSMIRPLSKSPTAQGILGGGLGGGMIGAFSPEQDTTLGGMTGAITGAVVGGTLPTAAGLVGKGIDRFVRGVKGEDVRAGKIMRELVGNEQLTPDPSLLTAQATQNVVPELAALQNEFQGYGGREWASKVDAQKAARKSTLGGFAGGQTGEQIRANSDLAKKILNEGLDPLRVEGADAANLNTKFFVDLTRELNEKREQAAKAVQTVRAAERGYKVGQSVFRQQNPMIPATPPGKYTPIGEISDRAAERGAAESLAAGEAARTAERRMEHTRAHGIAELSGDQIIGRIDRLLNERGARTNPVREKALSAVRDQLERFKDGNGNVDAYDLHGIRKNVNDLIAVTFPNADKGTRNKAVSELANVKSLIDESIMGAGGQPLVNYFEKFSEGMGQIRKAELIGELMQMSDKKIIDLAEGNAPKKIEKLLGPGKYRVDDIGEAADTIKQLAAKVKKDREIKEKAPFGSKLMTRIIEENSPTFPRVNLLNRTTQAINTTASAILDKLDDKTKMALAKAAASPIEAIRVMNTTPLVEQEKAYLLRWMREAGKSGMMSGAIVGGAME